MPDGIATKSCGFICAPPSGEELSGQIPRCQSLTAWVWAGYSRRRRRRCRRLLPVTTEGSWLAERSNYSKWVILGQDGGLHCSKFKGPALNWLDLYIFYWSKLNTAHKYINKSTYSQYDRGCLMFLLFKWIFTYEYMEDKVFAPSSRSCCAAIFLREPGVDHPAAWQWVFSWRRRTKNPSLGAQISVAHCQAQEGESRVKDADM